VFRRLHLNQWTETQEAWIKPHEWDVCRGEPRFDASQPSWIAVDVGVRRDSAAITWAQWHGEQLHVGQEILTPEDEGPTFGVADIRGRVAQRAALHAQLREVAYDPWQFLESAEILQERGMPMVEFPQNASRMAPASETLYELIVERRIVHDGNATMKEQILAAVIAPTERGGWRISKRKSLERIDGAVSLAMCADRAVTMRNQRPARRVVHIS
jgi:phage terminase large subunit-like protein